MQEIVADTEVRILQAGLARLQKKVAAKPPREEASALTIMQLDDLIDIFNELERKVGKPCFH